MKEIKNSENHAYHVTDKEEAKMLLEALTGDNPILTKEEIEKMLEGK